MGETTVRGVGRVEVGMAEAHQLEYLDDVGNDRAVPIRVLLFVELPSGG